MAVYGRVDQFNQEVESWTANTELLTAYFEANEVTDVSKQRAILLSVIGLKSNALMQNFVSPTQPTDKTYVLIKIIKNHHHPKPSVIVQRFKFITSFQQRSQTVSEFVAELR